MPIASLQNVNTHYGAQPVLKGASFELNTGQKLGLIGANGSGKTTILRVLLGREPVTGGAAYLDPGARVGYVPQHIEHDTGEAVMSWLLGEYKPIADALHAQEESLARTPAAEMDGAMRRYQQARDAYDRMDGDSWPRRAQTLLDAFGLGGKEEQRVASLSGGEKNVLSLAQALLSEPDLLLLDEPANHLDYLGVAWLESFLTKFKGTVLIVSHNRYLLDRVAGGILELEDGRVHTYHGGYSSYRGAKLRGLIAQQRDYVVNQRRLAQLEALVKRFEQIARSKSDPAWGKRLRARKSQLEREKRQAVDRPVAEPEGRQRRLHDRGCPVRYRPQGARVQQGLRQPDTLRRRRPGHSWRRARGAGGTQRRGQDHPAQGHRATGELGQPHGQNRPQYPRRLRSPRAGGAQARAHHP